MAPTADGTYTRDEMRDIVNAQTLSLRLEAIERRNEDNWQRFDRHTHDEEGRIESIYEKIDALDAKFGDSRQVVAQCKIELEDKIRAQYITKEQLELSLARTAESISRDIREQLRSFGNRMDEKIAKVEAQNQATADQLKKAMYIGTGILLAIMAVAWVAETVNNGAGAINGVQQQMRGDK